MGSLQEGEDVNDLWYKRYIARILSSEKYVAPEKLPFVAPEDLQYSPIQACE